MTHEEIAALNIAERYLMGKLSAEESARFEEHFVDCHDCLDRLESSKRFRGALKALGRDVLEAPAVPARLRGWHRAFWAMAAALLMAVGLSVFLAIRGLTLAREVRQTEIASRDWQQRYELERAAKQRAPLSVSMAGTTPTEPMLASTFFLSTLRGGTSDAAVPLNRVTLAGDAQWVVLSLEGELERGFRSLQVELEDSSGKNIWQQSGLTASPQQAVSVILPSTKLVGGDYELTLEGLSRSGRYTPLGHYRFRVATR